VGTGVPSETLRIFCHKSLEFQVSSIGAVQEDGFCWYATHQESQLHSGNGDCMHGLCAVVPRQRHSRRIERRKLNVTAADTIAKCDARHALLFLISMFSAVRHSSADVGYS